MAFRFRGACRSCGHEWHGFCRVYACGRTLSREPTAYRCYVCPKCFVQLGVPRLLNRSSWLRWVYENTTELTASPLSFRSCESGVRIDQQSLAVIARSPLLFEACQRVARILAGAHTRYISIPIDIGTISCTDCSVPMLDGDIETNSLLCPQCGNRSARSLGDRHPETLFVDYRPVENDLVRGVIDYLECLAENSEYAHFSISSMAATRALSSSTGNSVVLGTPS